MPAALIQLGSASYEQYGRKAYNVNASYQVWIFSNIKRSLEKNIDNIEIVIDKTIDKLLEIDEVTLKNVKEAYVNSNIIAYVINIDFEPGEVR